MNQINQLLELRNNIKNRKPEFIRQDNPKRKKLNDKWRKPKGIHSKIRHHFKGRRKMPSPGYKSPADVRGLHSTGLKIVIVSSIGGIENIIKESEGAVISKAVGMKKKIEILKKAKELNVKILNINADEHIKKIEDFINSKTKSKPALQKKDEKMQTESKERVPKDKKPGEKLSGDQKKEADKREKDKVLIQKV